MNIPSFRYFGFKSVTRPLSPIRATAVCLAWIACVPPASAGAYDAIGGALTGASKGMESYTRYLEQEQARKNEYERQRQLIEYQHQLEQQRIQQARDAELRQREAAEAQRKKAEEEAARNAVSTGTGFFVAPGGYLVTNNHVIQDRTDYAVRDLKGRFYKATAVARDTTRDLALLKVSGSFAPLRVASSETVSKGQRVLAVGYPQISIQGNESKVTDGIISSFSGINNDDHCFRFRFPYRAATQAARWSLKMGQ